jgi:hypothetical protein
LSALEVTKELIKRIITPLLGFIRRLVRLWAGIQSVVDVAVRRVRWLGSVMGLVILGRTMSVALAGNRVESRLKIVRSSIA